MLLFHFAPTLLRSGSSNPALSDREWLRPGCEVRVEELDNRLFRDLRSGRPGACAELVRDHSRAVYGFLVHLTGDIHKAEDLTQETFTTAWVKIATFQGRSTLATWLHRIAYTKFLDGRRVDQRELGKREYFSRPSFTQCDPVAIALANDEAQHLNRALQRLEAPERAVIVLHYLQGLNYREMAEVLEEPVGTVKWRTGKALACLRALLSHEVPDYAT